MPDFRPVRPFGEWPSLEAQSVDTRVASYVPENSIDSTHIRELSVTKLHGIGIRVYNSGAQTFLDNTEDDVDYNSVDFAEGFDSPSGTFNTVTIPYQGVYLLTGVQEWASADQSVFSWFYINSAKREGDSRSSDADAIAARVTLSAVRKLSAGDTVGMRCRQVTGASRDISAGTDNNSLTVVFLFPI